MAIKINCFGSHFILQIMFSNKLPKSPNRNKIDDLCVSLVEESFGEQNNLTGTMIEVKPPKVQTLKRYGITQEEWLELLKEQGV